MKSKKKKLIEFTREQLEDIVPDVKEHIEDVLDAEATDLKARLTLNFVTERLGDYYYNQGVEDAIAAMSQKLEDVYLLMRLRDERE